MDIFHAVLQMLCRGQDCKFCHIDNVKSLIKLQSTSFFIHIEPIYIVFISSCNSFQKLFKILQNGALVITAVFFFDSPCSNVLSIVYE